MFPLKSGSQGKYLVRLDTDIVTPPPYLALACIKTCHNHSLTDGRSIYRRDIRVLWPTTFARQGSCRVRRTLDPCFERCFSNMSPRYSRRLDVRAA